MARQRQSAPGAAGLKALHCAMHRPRLPLSILSVHVPPSSHIYPANALTRAHIYAPRQICASACLCIRPYIASVPRRWHDFRVAVSMTTFWSRELSCTVLLLRVWLRMTMLYRRRRGKVDRIIAVALIARFATSMYAWRHIAM